MSELHKAIEVGEYPAKCFQGSPRGHRRFLRQLVSDGRVCFVDSNGNPLDRDGVTGGEIHYDHWYVSKNDADTIAKEIARIEERLRQECDQRRKQEEYLATEYQRRQELIAEEKKRKKEKIAELKAAGLWDHPKYKTLKEARADGWHKRREDEVDGEEITLKGYTLVRNTTMLRYVYATTLKLTYGMTPSMIDELGEPDKYVTNPHYQSAPEGKLYLLERVEAWVDENQERIKKAQESRPKRSAAMVLVHEKKRAEALLQEQERLRLEEQRLRKEQKWLRTLPINVTRAIPSTVKSDAMSHKNQWGNAPTDPERAMRNHIRHRYTNYHSLLKQIEQRGFPYRLYPLLRELVDAVVEDALAKWKASAIEVSAGRGGE